jgi:hypothetical protein
MLLAAAVAAAVPTVRWCPLRWEQIDAERFLRCTTMVAAGLPSCGPSGSATATTPPDACGMPCAARAGVATCPLAETATSSAPQRTPPARHGHAYFLGDAGIRPRAALDGTPRGAATSYAAGVARRSVAGAPLGRRAPRSARGRAATAEPRGARTAARTRASARDVSRSVPAGEHPLARPTSNRLREEQRMQRFTRILLVVAALAVATAAVSQSSASHAKSTHARAVSAATASAKQNGSCPLGSCPLGSCPLGGKTAKAEAPARATASAPIATSASSASSGCSMDPASCPASCSRDHAASTSVAMTTR